MGVWSGGWDEDGWRMVEDGVRMEGGWGDDG